MPEHRAGGREGHETAPAREEAGRRAFLRTAFGALLGVVTAALAWPLVGSLLSPAYQRVKVQFTRVPGFGSVPVGQPVKLSFSDDTVDGYIRQHETLDVWVVKRSATEVTVFSPICTHLGCHYSWEAESKVFVCPCHASVFSPTGQVVGGPAPRGLDTLPSKIEGDELWVQWERFQAGTSEKIPV